jgi:hypothetical protein
MERADFTNSHHGAWTNKGYGGKKPSELIREHFYSCYIDDDYGLANRHLIGIERICLEVDYPHSDSVWPDVPEFVHASMERVPGGISDDEIDRITHLNGMELYKFDGMEQLGGRDKCTVGYLRSLAAHVDTEPKSLDGHNKPSGYKPGKVVTSGDVVGLFDKDTDNLDDESAADFSPVGQAR